MQGIMLKIKQQLMEGKYRFYPIKLFAKINPKFLKEYYR